MLLAALALMLAAWFLGRRSATLPMQHMQFDQRTSHEGETPHDWHDPDTTPSSDDGVGAYILLVCSVAAICGIALWEFFRYLIFGMRKCCCRDVCEALSPASSTAKRLQHLRDLTPPRAHPHAQVRVIDGSTHASRSHRRRHADPSHEAILCFKKDVALQTDVPDLPVEIYVSQAGHCFHTERSCHTLHGLSGVRRKELCTYCGRRGQ